METTSASPATLPRNFYRVVGKRLFDVAAAGLLLLLTTPFWVLTAILVRLKMGSPVLFRQQRPGYGGKPFMMIKFRSMSDERGSDGELLPDAQRLGRFGSILRSSSLDELPELLNVLKGDMSLVGPRPLLMQYLPLYTPEQARRHHALPGITGWAQINGRNVIKLSRRVELDVWYVDHQSFLLDLKILALTLPRVLSSRGVIVAETYEEMMDLGRGDDQGAGAGRDR
ncbi:sugar transferase [Mesoterricola sediminis]|uniref:Sugar transferase EpsL n=1 Tax=Mesoterricola sediminis TaxID=2927980 RepID=A0AA48KD24_9BACT|nr:putative sugar transferase EpsL [Mesoterricola sediminis]